MRRVLLLASTLVVAACGYHIGGAALTVPPSARTVSIELFGNRTREHGLELALRRALEELHLEFVLELLHVHREGRLGDMFPLGGPGDAARLEHGHEKTGLAQVDHQPPR